jgi:hypothetical protein
VIPPASERQKNNKKPSFPTNTSPSRLPSRLPFLWKGLGIGISPSRLPFLWKGLGIGFFSSKQPIIQIKRYIYQEYKNIVFIVEIRFLYFFDSKAKIALPLLQSLKKHAQDLLCNKNTLLF